MNQSQMQIQTRAQVLATTAAVVAARPGKTRKPLQLPSRCLAMAWFARRLREIFGPDVTLDLLPDQSVRVQVKDIHVSFADLDELLDTVS